MFPIFIFLIVFFILRQNSNLSTNALSKLYKIFNNQQYSNVKTLLKTNTLHLITADNNGENFLFALKNSAVQFTTTDIVTIHNHAENAHIHNVIIVTPLNNISSSIVRDKIKEFEFKIWTGNKLNALAVNNTTTSTDSAISSSSRITNVSVSNSNKTPAYSTSVAFNSRQYRSSSNEVVNNDPIQENYSIKNSWFRNLFKGPDRL